MKVKELKEALEMFHNDDEVYIYLNGERLDIKGYERTEYYAAGDSMDLLITEEYDKFIKKYGGVHL